MSFHHSLTQKLPSIWPSSTQGTRACFIKLTSLLSIYTTQTLPPRCTLPGFDQGVDLCKPAARHPVSSYQIFTRQTLCIPHVMGECPVYQWILHNTRFLGGWACSLQIRLHSTMWLVESILKTNSQFSWIISSELSSLKHFYLP